jgi:hypothetical protein
MDKKHLCTTDPGAWEIGDQAGCRAVAGDRRAGGNIIYILYLIINILFELGSRMN